MADQNNQAQAVIVDNIVKDCRRGEDYNFNLNFSIYSDSTLEMKLLVYHQAIMSWDII
jgi:hypothetical protein